MHILINISNLFNTFKIKYIYQTSIHPITQFQYKLDLITSITIYKKKNSTKTNNNIYELKN